jgi:hypothetical protein
VRTTLRDPDPDWAGGDCSSSADSLTLPRSRSCGPPRREIPISNQRQAQSERVEKRVAEDELIALLTPDEKTRRRKEARARRMREAIDRTAGLPKKKTDLSR